MVNMRPPLRDTVDDFARYIRNFHPDSNIELVVATALLDTCCRFVSERMELEPLFENILLPALEHFGPDTYRIWCASCRTGQETFTRNLCPEGHVHILE